MTNITKEKEINFLGLNDHYTKEENANIVIYPIAFDLTTSYQHGTDKGPLALLDASQYIELYDIETDFEAYKKGIFTHKFQSYQSSEDMLDQVYSTTSEYIKKGKFVAALGGEHSISFPLIKAHSDAFKNISVLQIDAHADLHPALDGNPFSHGSVMSRVRELNNIKSHVAVGIRSMAVEEKPFIDHKRTFFAHDIQMDDTWMEKAIDQLSDQVYITFDLDAFDSSLMPATGTPEPGGLTWNTALRLLRKVASKKQVVGFDVVELLPLENFQAPNYLASKLVYKLLNYIFEGK
ncbi:MAG: agmatinase [Chlamydiota bacterium]|jgi:agmatinase